MRGEFARGFTLIELMVVVAIIGLLAATAIPAFVRYTKKARTAEARLNVRKVYDGARQYYLDRNAVSVTGMQQLYGQFPYGGGILATGSLACCLQTPLSTSPTCPPGADTWEMEPWKSLHFGLTSQTYFGYSYTSGIMPFLTDQEFNVQARADQDCDGYTSSFSMYGFVNSIYGDGPIGTSKITRYDELE